MRLLLEIARDAGKVKGSRPGVHGGNGFLKRVVDLGKLGDANHHEDLLEMSRQPGKSCEAFAP